VNTPFSKNFAAEATVPATAVPLLPRWTAAEGFFVRGREQKSEVIETARLPGGHHSFNSSGGA
jgi:hypothetical protein